jgi:hypothetical protein
MLKLFWYCLSIGKEEQIGEKEQNFVSDNLDKLSSLLKTSLVGITLEAKPLPPRLVEVVNGEYESWRDHGLSCHNFCLNIRNKLNSLNLKDMPLLVYCKNNSNLAKAAVKENSLAQWGLTRGEYLVSAVYEPDNKYVLWHETLHLFDACDCYCYYNPNAGSNCELNNCIMQYEPTKENVGEWPFLCQKNIERIQAWSKKHKLNDIA